MGFIIHILTFCVYAAFIGTVIALFLLIVKAVKAAYNRTPFKNSSVTKIPPINMLYLFIPIAVAIVLTNAITEIARGEIISFLDALPQNCMVLINGQIVSNSDEIIDTLKTVRPRFGLAHHSHPTNMLRIEVNGQNGRMIVDLGRDSMRPQEYWVYYPSYRITNNIEIGRITTGVFDKF